MVSIDYNKETVHIAFQENHKVLEEKLNTLQLVSLSERPALIDQCLAGISHLSNLLKDASSYLPAYDQRAYSLKVKTLSEELSGIRQSLTPKQKFSFKSRRSNAATIGGAVDIGAFPAPPQAQDAAEKVCIEQENIIIASRQTAYICPPINKNPVSASLLLSSLKECIVTLPSSIKVSSSAVKDVDASLLLLENTVNGPIHLTSVSNSVLVFSCRQFRMHDAQNVDVYLHCTSRPIIEDCKGIRFHRYGNTEGNLWNQVDDFKWLRHEKSPHFDIVHDADGNNQIWDRYKGKTMDEAKVRVTLEILLKSNPTQSTS